MSAVAQTVRADPLPAMILAERINTLKGLRESATKAAVDEAMRYADAKAACQRLTDEQRLHLAGYLVDAAGFDDPDLLREIEGALRDALAIVRGEA